MARAGPGWPASRGAGAGASPPRRRFSRLVVVSSLRGRRCCVDSAGIRGRTVDSSSTSRRIDSNRRKTSLQRRRTALSPAAPPPAAGPRHSPASPARAPPVSKAVSRSMPTRSSASSSTRPAGPTNGSPSLSSWSPGCSPTSISRAGTGPLPNTVWVARSHRSQAWHPADASRSSAMPARPARAKSAAMGGSTPGGASRRATRGMVHRGPSRPRAVAAAYPRYRYAAAARGGARLSRWRSTGAAIRPSGGSVAGP